MEDVALATLGVRREKILQQIATFTEYNDFLSAALEARRHRDASSWILGCLALGIAKKYGEDTIGKFAKEAGTSVSSLQVYRWVVAKFIEAEPNYVPPESVSFGVLEAAARLPNPEERNKMVEDAADNGMTVERARVEVKKKNGNSIPVKPKFKLVWCPVHNKWSFVPENPNEFHALHDGI